MTIDDKSYSITDLDAKDWAGQFAPAQFVPPAARSVLLLVETWEKDKKSARSFSDSRRNIAS